MNRSIFKTSIFIFSFLFSQFFNLSIARTQSFTELHSFGFFADTVTNYSSTWIDADQDYDVDLLKFSILNKPNQFYVNSNNTLGKTNSIFNKDGGNANGACYADIDLDGDLDIFVYSIFGQKNCLYLQEAKGLFRKDLSMDIVKFDNNAFYACFSDIDLDNDPDLIISDTELWNSKSIRKPTIIYYNDGKGNFSLENAERFFVKKSNTRAVLLSDLNQDGREDMLLINFGAENELYLKNDANVFNAVSTNLSINTGDYMDAISADIDNDGDLDVFVADVKAGVDLYRNDGHLLFAKVPNVFQLQNFTIAGIESCDWNNDGKIDIILHKAFSVEKRIFINTSEAQNYITLKLRADRANVNGIQTKVYVYTQQNTNDYKQYKELRATKKSNIADAFDLHFGIGEAKSIDSIKLIWPDGTEQILKNIEANYTYFIEQRAIAKRIENEHLAISAPAYIKNLSISAVADYFKLGEISGITVFYENNGLVSQDVEVDLNLSVPMKLFNSFPMPQAHTDSTFHWTIKDVPAKFRGIITLSVNTPNFSAHSTQKVIVSISPIIGDENSSDNELEIVKEIE